MNRRQQNFIRVSFPNLFHLWLKREKFLLALLLHQYTILVLQEAVSYQFNRPWIQPCAASATHHYHRLKRRPKKMRFFLFDREMMTLTEPYFYFTKYFHWRTTPLFLRPSRRNLIKTCLFMVKRQQTLHFLGGEIFTFIHPCDLSARRRNFQKSQAILPPKPGA